MHKHTEHESRVIEDNYWNQCHWSPHPFIVLQIDTWKRYSIITFCYISTVMWKTYLLFQGRLHTKYLIHSTLSLMECFGVFYNYSQQPSPEMYFSWKHTKLFVPRSVTQALQEKKKSSMYLFYKRPKGSKFCLKVPSNVCSRQSSLPEDRESPRARISVIKAYWFYVNHVGLHGYSTKAFNTTTSLFFKNKHGSCDVKRAFFFMFIIFTFINVRQKHWTWFLRSFLDAKSSSWR